LQTDACVFGAVEQGTFLRACGYDARLERLLAVCSKNAERDAVRTSAEYLVKPAHMGSRFKVMAILPGVLRDIFRVRHAPLGFLGAEIMPFL
jgi:SAM-dependent MidA family methyltransferase